MANVLKSKGFKYIKNLIIGVGASVVLMGALFKIQSWPGADEMLTYGMITEAVLFLMLGLIPPDKDYYWEKLYPGLDKYNDKFNREEYGLSSAGGSSTPGLDGKVVESQLGGMLGHLQTMSDRLGALKSLQEVDFSGVSPQLKTASDFYKKLNEAMKDLEDSADTTRAYKEQLSSLNSSINGLVTKYDALNQTYDQLIAGVAGSVAPKLKEAVANIDASAESAKAYKNMLAELNDNIGELNKKYAALNQIYGGVITAMGGKA